MPSNCGTCGAAFTVEPEEQGWLAEQDDDLPMDCPRCRAFTTGIQDETITCTVCGKVFIFPRELRLFSRMFKWMRPRRCMGGCKTHGPELTEEELRMADFLKRLRSSRNINAALGTNMHAAGTSLSRRITGVNAGPRSSSAAGKEEVGGSLAQALKEFQDRKRGRRR